MRLLLHMKLESDAIFGNGMNIPGGEDICVQADENGFPYLKGSSMKGIFREELINYLIWTGRTDIEINGIVNSLMGEGGSMNLETDMPRKMVFSDMYLNPAVCRRIIEEGIMPDEVLEMFSYLRTFTSIENRMVKEKTLRMARCLKKGLNFYGICECNPADCEIVEDVFGIVKWVGTMRNRGFGKIRIEVEKNYA